MTLDPIELTNNVRDSYLRYLRTVLRTGDPGVNGAIEQGLRRVEAGLVVGPILESAPPFEDGRTLSELARAGELSPEWLRDPFPDGLPMNRPLYLHQDQAISKALCGRNLIVATGTGSGKTETFLVPILDALLREKAAGTLGPGVRALLLYPMNALANDQLKRLRALLATEPSITFGRYTGETKPRRREALEQLRQSGIDGVSDNELVSREEMQAAPPHLLLTNYAMLEYLLMRPDDSPLFDVRSENTWRFIVLDEVHTYNGTSGLEVAMLLRRVFDRTGRSGGDVRTFGTSATVSGGKDDLPAVAQFGRDLFGSLVEFEPAAPARQDIVMATRRRRPLPDTTSVIDLEAASRMADSRERGRALLGDPRVQALLASVAEGPTRLSLLGRKVFPREKDASTKTSDLVRLLSNSQDPVDDANILSARYHTFVRALNGVQICLRAHGPAGSPFVTLEEDRSCPECGPEALLSEMATCRRCGQWHLRGTFNSDPGVGRRLTRRLDLDDVDLAVKYLAPVSSAADADDEGAVEVEASVDEGQLSDADDSGTSRTLTLCTYCLSAGDSAPACGHPPASMRAFTSAARHPHSGAIICVNCGTSAAVSGPRRLRLGADAPPAVLASALYDGLPPGDDGVHRKFISFADSRQDAAFFAPYLERTYGNVHRRRTLMAVLGQLWARHGGDGLRPNDIRASLEKAAMAAGYFGDPRMSRIEREGRVMSWLVAELTAIDRRQSLHGVGLMDRRLVKPANWKAPSVLLEPPWSLDADEAWTLVETLIGTLLDRGIVAFPDGIDPAWDIFRPRARQAYIRRDGADQKIGTEAWLPANNHVHSSRIDYVLRVLQSGFPGGERAAAQLLLEQIWDRLLADPKSPLAGWLKLSTGQAGIRFQADLDFWELNPPGEGLRCTHCGGRWPAAVRCVCPTMRCAGLLRPDEPDSDDHYRWLYENDAGAEMRVEEHTAQWTADEATSVQQRFVSGDIDVLSCSTTFELGVDLGDLQAVFLRNIPPLAANYVQRAGRAGRRTESVAYILCFAQLRPHDQQAFMNPEAFVAGIVPPPRIADVNGRIVRRHIHSVAVSRFFRMGMPTDSSAWRTAGEFFLDDSPTFAEQLRTYLSSRAPELQAELRRIVPPALQAELGVDDWTWADYLIAEPLDNAERDITSDSTAYDQLIAEAVAARNFRKADFYQSVLRTIRSQYLLGYLAQHNVLPKYGFPVDVVPLKTNHLPDSDGQRIALDRDLRIAVSEFAPGAGVVAAKQLWVSAGLRRFPNRGLPEHHYSVCRTCRRFQISADASRACDVCGNALQQQGTFVEPVFGFVAMSPAARPLGDERPLRLYGSEVYFAELSTDALPPRSEIVRTPAGTVVGRFSRNGRLALVNTGKGRGFRYCQSCGFAELRPNRPPKGRKGHKDPLSGRNCGGLPEIRHIGHTFATDMAEFVLPGLRSAKPADLSSIQAALAEGASRALSIRRGEIEGTYHFESDGPVFIVYDNVPGGAGLARRIVEQAPLVLQAAHDLVARCDCGEASSCYRCLRNYSNQRFHEDLNRSAVARFLEPLVGGIGARPTHA